jgi:DNA repair protein RecO (recombination protein O)
VRHPTDTTDALLLRAVDYSEADRIVTLLTADFGKASFIARGARRSKKRFSGTLQPFQLLRVELSHGRGELGTLARAQIVRPFPRVLGDLARMGAGFAALELVRELLPEREADPAPLGLTLELLDRLDQVAAPSARLLVCFEARLLSLCGFAPQLQQCGLCGRKPGETQAAEFDPHSGHLVCRRCGGASHRLTGPVRAALQLASGPDWSAAAQAAWAPPAVAEAHAVLRVFAEHRIGKALEADSLLQTALRDA